MVFVSIFVILVLLWVTLWLWHLSRAQLIHFTILTTESSMTVGRSVSKQPFSRHKEAASLLRLRMIADTDDRARAEQEALAAAQAIADEDGRARALVRLVPHLPASLLPEALAAARAIADEGKRVWTLVRLAPYLPVSLQMTVLSEVLATARAIVDEDKRARALVELAPYLPASLLPEALAALPVSLLPEALVAVQMIADEDKRAWVIWAIANKKRYPETLSRRVPGSSASSGSIPVSGELAQVGEPQQPSSSKAMSSPPLAPPPSPLTARYSGMASLPKKVYEGDSQNISLVMSSMSKVAGLLPEAVHVQDTKVDLYIQERDRSEQFLEVELLAAALSIDGEKKQKQSLTQEKLTYQWNCQFKYAGNHEICLVLKVVEPSGERNLGKIEQTIRVVKFDHATQRQVQAGAAVAGTGALLLAIANLVSTVLGLWHLH